MRSYGFTHPSFSLVPYSAYKRYVSYLNDVACCRTCIFFKSIFRLNNWRPAEVFLILRIKLYTSELSDLVKNSTPSYGTVPINGSYLFCCLYSVLSFIQQSNNKNVSDLPPFSVLTKKTFKIHNSIFWEYRHLVSVTCEITYWKKYAIHVWSSSIISNMKTFSSNFYMEAVFFCHQRECFIR